MKFTFLFLSVFALLSGCKKDSNDSAVKPGSVYFLKATVDGKVYEFDVSDKPASNSVDNGQWPGQGQFSIGGYDNNQATSIGFATNEGLRGSPKKLTIVYGTFSKNRFENYNKSMNNSPNTNVGSCDITKVNNDYVEGTFHFDAFDNTNKKLSVTDGSFKMRFH